MNGGELATEEGDAGQAKAGGGGGGAQAWHGGAQLLLQKRRNKVCGSATASGSGDRHTGMVCVCVCVWDARRTFANLQTFPQRHNDVRSERQVRAGVVAGYMVSVTLAARLCLGSQLCYFVGSLDGVNAVDLGRRKGPGASASEVATRWAVQCSLVSLRSPTGPRSLRPQLLPNWLSRSLDPWMAHSGAMPRLL